MAPSAEINWTMSGCSAPNPSSADVTRRREYAEISLPRVMSVISSVGVSKNGVLNL